MNLSLYPAFKKWEEFSNIWIYSDPHFNDPDSKIFRKNCPSAEEQVKLINSKCGKKDLLIVLGDICDIEPIKKLKAAYKVLILGNHDKGASYYQRGKDVDNHLFDEVYDGPILIRKDILLSHVPVDYKYAFNIHGHVHDYNSFEKYVLKNNIENKYYFEAQIGYIKAKKLTHFNACCEWLNYEPIPLNAIIKSGCLKDIPNSLREAIDKQIERKKEH